MNAKVAIVNHGSGNIFSIRNALEKVGVQHCFVSRPEELIKFDAIVLPGVGAYGNAVQNLLALGLFDAIKEYKYSGRPIVGICLGMQLLFEGSAESAGVHGFGFVPGFAAPFVPNSVETRLNVGWLQCHSSSINIFDNAISADKFYFNHSYRIPWKSNFVGSTWAERSDGRFVAAIRSENIIGFQYHPEKSGTLGLDQLKSAIT